MVRYTPDRPSATTCGNKNRQPDFSVLRKKDKLYVRADENSSVDLIRVHKWVTATIHPDGVQDYLVVSQADFRWKLKTVFIYAVTLRFIDLNEEDCLQILELMESSEPKKRLYFLEINNMTKVSSKTIQSLLSGRETDCLWIEKSSISAKECFNHETVIQAPEFVLLSCLRVEDEDFAEEIFRLKANWLHLDIKGMKLTVDEIRLFIEDRLGNPRPEMFLGFHVDFPEDYDIKTLINGYKTLPAAGYDRKNNARYKKEDPTIWIRWDKTHFTIGTVHDAKRQRTRTLVWHTNQEMYQSTP